MANLPDHIQKLIAARSRELHLAPNGTTEPSINDLVDKPQVDSIRPREVYKDKKTKRLKDSSRMSGVDDHREKVSARPAFWPEAVASKPMAADSVISPAGAVGVESTPAPGTAAYSGITVQQARSEKGIKLYITLQRSCEQISGEVLCVTAELKRWNRLREIKPRELDTDIFNTWFVGLREELREQIRQQPNLAKTIVIGRIHERGWRREWLQDTLAIGYLTDQKITRVLLYLMGEQHVIEMDLPLSPNQQKYYHTSGIWGEIKRGKRAPRLDDLPRTRLRDG